MQNQSNNNLIVDIKEVIDHIDRAKAVRILEEIKKGNISDSQVLESKKYLQIVAFPSISDENAGAVIKNNILDFFRLGVSLENSIEARYTMQGHYEKNNQRKILKKNVLENLEKIGELTIGEWIKLFEQKRNLNEREDIDISNFMLSNSEVQKLSKQQKDVLKKIIYSYDRLLSDHVIDIFDLAEIKERLRRQGASTKKSDDNRFQDFYRKEQNFGIADMKNYKKNDYISSGKIELSKLSIVDAMEKYPAIQDQLISQNLIKLSNKSNLVKGSIRNWIKDYYLVIGAGNRDIMRRSGYIYHGHNTKELNVDEKQNLALVLKSLDDNSLLDVDVANQQIVFGQANNNSPEIKNENLSIMENDNAEKEVERLRFPQNNTTSKINHIQGNNFNLRSDHFEERKEKTGMMSNLLEKKAEDDNIRFSTSQKLPVEMEEKEDKNS